MGKGKVREREGENTTVRSQLDQLRDLGQALFSGDAITGSKPKTLPEWMIACHQAVSGRTSEAGYQQHGQDVGAAAWVAIDRVSYEEEEKDSSERGCFTRDFDTINVFSASDENHAPTKVERCLYLNIARVMTCLQLALKRIQEKKKNISDASLRQYSENMLRLWVACVNAIPAGHLPFSSTHE